MDNFQFDSGWKIQLKQNIEKKLCYCICLWISFVQSNTTYDFLKQFMVTGPLAGFRVLFSWEAHLRLTCRTLGHPWCLVHPMKTQTFSAWDHKRPCKPLRCSFGIGDAEFYRNSGAADHPFHLKKHLGIRSVYIPRNGRDLQVVYPQNSGEIVFPYEIPWQSKTFCICLYSSPVNCLDGSLRGLAIF